MKGKIFFIYFIYLFLFHLNAESFWGKQFPEQYFAEAHQYYKNQQYQDAVRIYTDLLKEFPNHFGLYYNLANTHFKIHKQINQTNQHLAHAIYFYQKTIETNPNFTNAIQNLQTTMLHVSNNYETIKLYQPTPWYLLFSFSDKMNQILLNILFLLVCILMSFLILKRRKKGYKIAIILLSMLYLVLITNKISAYYFLKKSNFSNKKIIGLKSAFLKKEPLETSENEFELHEGNLVTILKKEDLWYLVTLPNGQSGWIEDKAFLRID